MSFDYVQRTKAMPGKKRAATALRWIADGAESPMEIKSRLLLTLPYRYGGYGLPMPEVNKDILLSGRTGHRVVRTFRPDMCWPCHKVIVEYDGKAYHEDAHKDKRRSNALESLGWHVLYITKEELHDIEQFDMLARQLGRLLGTRVRPPADWGSKRVRARKELLLPMYYIPPNLDW